jgi:hypothetical protein
MGLFVTSSYTVMIVLANKWLKAQSNLEPDRFDFSALTTEELDKRRYGSKLVIVVEQMQIAVIWSCKACLLIMYQRITRTALQKENVAIKILSAYTALGFVIIEVLYFAAWCRPFSEYYAVPTSSSQCNALVHHRITKAVFNISSDLIMLCIALQMLIRSLLPVKRKLILCGIFSLGIFVVAASILNSYYSFQNPYRPTWIFWYVRESSTAVLVANLPFTWKVLQKFIVIGEFDETNPPPWTYHSSRTAGGRKTAQLLHLQQTGTLGAGTQRSPHNSKGSNGTTRSMTLVGSNIAKEPSNQPTSSEQSENTEKDLLHEAIKPHDFAPVLLQTADDGIIKLDLESGLNEPHVRPVSPDHIVQRSKLASSPPTIIEDGTGGFYINDRPVSPPSRAHLRTRNDMDERPISAASSYATEGRRGSADSQGGHMAGGGRSARDRRKRTRMSG